MDRLLHRGAYALPVDPSAVSAGLPKKRLWLSRLIGIDENFSTGDKWIAGSLFVWSALFSCLFVMGTTWNSIHPWPDSFWPPFWHVVGIGFPIFFALVTGIWFTWGGVRGIRRFFVRLRSERVNHLDDGTVKDQHNLGERFGVSEKNLNTVK